jgi:hypothetical protein
MGSSHGGRAGRAQGFSVAVCAWVFGDRYEVTQCASQGNSISAVNQRAALRQAIWQAHIAKARSERICPLRRSTSRTDRMALRATKGGSNLESAGTTYRRQLDFR